MDVLTCCKMQFRSLASSNIVAESRCCYGNATKSKSTHLHVYISFILGFFFVVQMMTQRAVGSPRKRGHEDLHLQSCGALSSSPSMHRPKRIEQTTSTSTNPLDTPSSEQSLECKETILWPFCKPNTEGTSRLPVLRRCSPLQTTVVSLITLTTLKDDLFSQCDCSSG